ncbi:ABC transporter substrate-binding protein [Sphingomonas lutea]|uniref:ABC transporter substrate-binding protein n=1 Tax=Sphingomonas lutea TaxID=1045317 RepID=A0A7G9SJJ1_9SPHN|nr:ABC transporter substrate-binding protein [Sphingomonas lutea]QNN68016.1 ABC transporter substrate-binding protein [Sphingomonas lutea]
MPALSLRRAFAWLALGALSVLASACEDEVRGDIRVLVIGDPPKVRDPSQEPLSYADGLLLGEVAQGLVRLDAGGNVVAGLAERWNVSDDGRSYIFRIASAQWPDGRKITAQQVARALKRQLNSRSKNPLKDTLGAIDDVVAMTDRVIEIRLHAPRPNLLALLAQPEFAILRDGHGTGPFAIDPAAPPNGDIRLVREIMGADGELSRREEVLLGHAEPREAISAFARGDAQMVLGGTFSHLPWAQAARLPRGSLRFDPASGLFGLAPATADGPYSDPQALSLLSQAIDRSALVALLNVPGLNGRATVLEPGLDGISAVVQPSWLGIPIQERRPALIAQAAQMFGDNERRVVRVLLPEGPGADRLLALLSRDWGVLGLTVERAENGRNADFRLIDAVAPSTSPAWFLRNFRCGVAPRCDEEVDTLLDAARETQVPAQRYALLLQAAALIDDRQLFIPLTAPIRWSLVSPQITGFAGNRQARHTLTDLGQPLSTGG